MEGQCSIPQPVMWDVGTKLRVTPLLEYFCPVLVTMSFPFGELQPRVLRTEDLGFTEVQKRS